jgi:Na+/H+-dicarboxylate symporter
MKISIKYGIISGIIISAWIIGGNYFEWYQTGFAKAWLFLVYIFQIILLYLGIKETKVKKYSGRMSYVSALLSGLVITLVLATIYSLANYLYFRFGNSNILNFALSENNRILTEMKKTEDIAKRSKMITDAFSPGNQASSAFTEKLIIGIVFTFIFAMILRKRDEPVIMEEKNTKNN